MIYNKHFTILPEKRKKKKERKSIKETLEKTEGAIKNGQSRENRRGNQEWTIQRKPKGQSRMDNPKKTEGAIKNGQSRENRRGNQEWTIQRNWQDWVHKTQDEDKQNKNQHNMICVSL